MKKLEDHKSFSVVAWVLVFAFAFFTFNLVQTTNNNVEEIFAIDSISRS